MINNLGIINIKISFIIRKNNDGNWLKYEKKYAEYKNSFL